MARQGAGLIPVSWLLAHSVLLVFGSNSMVNRDGPGSERGTIALAAISVVSGLNDGVARSGPKELVRLIGNTYGGTP